jgi:hypothetical protein
VRSRSAAVLSYQSITSSTSPAGQLTERRLGGAGRSLLRH